MWNRNRNINGMEIIFRFSAFTNGCTRPPGTAIQHVPGGPFWPDGKLTEVRKSRGVAWHHFMWPSSYSICQNWDTAVIFENPSRKELSRPELYDF